MRADVVLWKGTGNTYQEFGFGNRQQLTEMRKRLRKKKRVAEFQELGLDVRAVVNCDDPEAFVDRWIAELDSNELAFGGRAGPDGLDGFVTRFVRDGVTADDRMAIIAFLEGDLAVVHYEVGGLRDAWYGWD